VACEHHLLSSFFSGFYFEKFRRIGFKVIISLPSDVCVSIVKVTPQPGTICSILYSQQ